MNIVSILIRVSLCYCGFNTLNLNVHSYVVKYYCRLRTKKKPYQSDIKIDVFKMYHIYL